MSQCKEASQLAGGRQQPDSVRIKQSKNPPSSRAAALPLRIHMDFLRSPPGRGGCLRKQVRVTSCPLPCNHQRLLTPFLSDAGNAILRRTPSSSPPPPPQKGSSTKKKKQPTKKRSSGGGLIGFCAAMAIIVAILTISGTWIGNSNQNSISQVELAWISMPTTCSYFPLSPFLCSPPHHALSRRRCHTKGTHSFEGSARCDRERERERDR